MCNQNLQLHLATVERLQFNFNKKLKNLNLFVHLLEDSNAERKVANQLESFDLETKLFLFTTERHRLMNVRTENLSHLAQRKSNKTFNFYFSEDQRRSSFPRTRANREEISAFRASLRLQRREQTEKQEKMLRFIISSKYFFFLGELPSSIYCYQISQTSRVDQRLFTV